MILHKIYGYLLLAACLQVFSTISKAQSVKLPDMQMRIEGSSLIIRGSLDTSKYTEFNDLLATNVIGIIIFNDVLGGTIRSVEWYGNKIAGLSIATKVDGKCYSACALVFLKGSNRSVNKMRNNVIGFHGPRGPRGEALVYFVAVFKAWILKSTDGKFTPELIDKALSINSNDGALFIFTDTFFGLFRTWALLCENSEECISVPNANPYDLGILTEPR